MTALDVLIEENLAERASRLGEYFRSAVRALNSPHITEVRGKGLLNAIVMDEKKSRKGKIERGSSVCCWLVGVCWRNRRMRMCEYHHTLSFVVCFFLRF
jgi:4-aminobutyrate aminotransferase-like enzyme